MHLITFFHFFILLFVLVLVFVSLQSYYHVDGIPGSNVAYLRMFLHIYISEKKRNVRTFHDSVPLDDDNYDDVDNGDNGPLLGGTHPRRGIGH